MRLYELAKELGYAPKDFVAEAAAKHIKIKNHLVTLDEETVTKLRQAFGKPKAGEKPAPDKTSDAGGEAIGQPKRATHSEKAKPALAGGIQAKAVDTLPDKNKPSLSLIDKPAHTEKEVRALRPNELEEKDTLPEVKEKRRLKIFSKSPALKQMLERGRMPSHSPGVLTHPAPRPVIPKKPPSGRKIFVEPPVTIKDISEKIGIKAGQIIQKLMGHSMMLTVNDTLDEDTLILIGLEFNYDIELKKPKDILSELIKSEEDKPEDLVTRPPVVVIMGHVDHGKTSLLDRIRTTNIASQEAGQITQHIGAYQSTINNRKITFLDTPGHEAFTNMRARGANVTDIAVLVVAADDGVMPQTEEAINHIKAANVPVIVAINKIDKKDANIIKVKQQLSSLGLISEEWGGKTIVAEVSALTGQGLDHFLEMLALQSEVLELKANPKRKATGTVLEARLTEDTGPRATVLVQNGTLHKGDAVVCGATYGKIRTMYGDKIKQIDAAPPATPVGITGLVELPETGNKLFVVDNIKQAKEIADSVKDQKRNIKAGPSRHLTMETLFSRIAQDKVQEIRIIIKADFKGSIEVLGNLIEPLSADEIKMKIIHSGVGSITESDVILADASDAIIVGFNVTPDERTRALAQERGVQIKSYNIIYQMIEELKLALKGLLKPEKVEVITAHLTVRELFKISRFGTIAGSAVTDGKIERSNLIRLHRDKKVIFEGKISSLKRFKEDVREVAQGFECGIKLEGFDNIHPGDVIEAYRIEERARKL